MTFWNSQKIYFFCKNNSFKKNREIATTVPILAKHSKNMNLEKISKEDLRKSICFWYEGNCKDQKRSELTNIVKYT